MTSDTAPSVSPRPSRLEWSRLPGLDAAQQASLMGPGAPFEMHSERVLGTDLEVFVRRDRSILDSLRTAATRWPERDYVVFPDRHVTYGEIIAPIATAARRLSDDYGIGRGDRVAILSANVYEYVVTFWAIVAVGAIDVALNGWWTAAEIMHGIELTEPKLIFADGARAERLAGRELGVPLVPFEGAPWWGTDDPAATLPEVHVDEDDPFAILFTSGTTGRAKGAVITHRSNIHFNMAHALSGAATALLNGSASSGTAHRVLGAAPLFHVSGLTAQLTMAPMSGMAIYYPPVGRWSERRHLEMTQQHRITRWSLVPTQAWRIVEVPDIADFDLSSVVGFGGGSAVWPPELLRTLHERVPAAVRGLGLGYGMTETTGLGTSLPAALVVDHPDSVGVASPGVSVEVRDPDTGEVLPEGSVGEICIRTAANILGYWGDPAATARALDAERWYRTGDFGAIRDGLLYVEGRRSDLIIRGGENIYPAEIENRLMEHPGVSEAAVVGVPHPQLGEEVVAFVLRAPAAVDGVAGDPVTGDELAAFVGEALAPFKVPREVHFVESFPRTATGKIIKAELVDDTHVSAFVGE